MKEHKIFNIKINEISFPELLYEIENAIYGKNKNENKIKISYTNPHLVRLSHKDGNLLRVLNEFDLNHIDGTGLKIAFKVLNNKLIPRFNWTDHALTFLSECEKKEWSIFFLGGEQSSISTVVKKVKQSFPRLRLAGFLNGYQDLINDPISLINQSNPDIIWVGLGSPKQEMWVDKNFEKLNCMVIQCVGDIFNSIVGKRFRGPVFLRKLGFEWLFRLIQHPLKYFNRYVIGIPFFFYLILINKLRMNKK